MVSDKDLQFAWVMQPALIVLALLLCPSHAQSEPAEEDSDFSSPEAAVESLLTRAKHLTKGKGGEVVIGCGAGVVTGWACKKIQSTMVNTALVCGAAATAACAAGYLDMDIAIDKFGQAGEYVEKTASGLLGMLDRNGDGKVDAADGNYAMSKIRPFAKKHVGLTAGFASGLLVGYQLG